MVGVNVDIHAQRAQWKGSGWHAEKNGMADSCLYEDAGFGKMNESASAQCNVSGSALMQAANVAHRQREGVCTAVDGVQLVRQHVHVVLEDDGLIASLHHLAVVAAQPRHQPATQGAPQPSGDC